MEENFKNKLGLTMFILLILGLGVGGYFFTNYIINLEDVKEEDQKNQEENISYKIDEKKDYIYFINEEVISEKAEIFYKDVVINLTTQNTLNERLKKENQIYKNNIIYLDEKDLLNSEIVKYNYDNIEALTYREYDNYQYDKYLSLVIRDYNFSCFDKMTFNESKSYIFNIENGKLLEEEEILDLYNTNLENIKEDIKDYLEKEQSLVEEVEIIKIDDTINNLNYAFYINNYGDLYISYLVKTTEVDYNEIMEVN